MCRETVLYRLVLISVMLTRDFVGNMNVIECYRNMFSMVILAFTK